MRFLTTARTGFLWSIRETSPERAVSPGPMVRSAICDAGGRWYWRTALLEEDGLVDAKGSVALHDAKGVLVEGYVSSEPFPFVEGSKLSVQTIGLPPATEPDLRVLRRDGEFKGALLGLWSTKQDGGYVQGTAFLIAPGLALTAAHVIDEYIEQYGLADGGSSLMAVGTDNGQIVAWVVNELVKAENSDVAILSMTLYAPAAEHLLISHFQVGTRLPVAGEFVRMLGTHSPTPEGRITVPDERDRVGRVELATVLSSGPVLEALPHGRGVMLPNPGFVADLTVVGGMSGGPVFDQTGRVIGLLTSGQFNPDDPAGKYALVSLLWASLWADFTCSWPPKLYPAPCKLVDVIEPYEALRVQPDGEGRLAYLDFAMNDPLPGAPPA